ncbi:MAG: type I-D CRISPR-associated protein Cas5/Csc1 [Bacillota bacterium]
MNVYELTITLSDTAFFASREVARLYLTEPYLHNYALTYALGLATSTYHDSVHVPRYAEQLQAVNDLGVYVTPGQPKRVVFSAHTFKFADVGYHVQMEQSSVNVPTFGRARELGPESVFRAYVLSQRPIEEVYSRLERPVPSWIRLGKWMSKAAVEWEPAKVSEGNTYFEVEQPLNALDTPQRPLIYDLINMPPVSLIKGARFHGPHLSVGPGMQLPLGMAYRFPLKA